MQRRADHTHPATGGQQTTRLAGRNPATAHHEAEFAANIKAERIHRLRKLRQFSGAALQPIEENNLIPLKTL